MPELTYTGGGTQASFIASASGQIPTFPSQLNALIQQGFLKRELEEGLDSRLAYRARCARELIPNRVGETFTFTRKSRLAPNLTPANPSTNSGLDNGLSSVTFNMEQYQATLQQWGQTTDVDLLAEQAGIGDQVLAAARNNGVQAAQTMERLSRNALLQKYLSGNTYILSSPAPTTASIHVNDINGFQHTLVNGQLVSVSATNPISVTEVPTAGGTQQTYTVTAASPDATNISTTKTVDGSQIGISGTLTITASTAPTANNSLIGSQAPRIIRQVGAMSPLEITAAHMLTTSLVMDAVALLRANAVPALRDGTYHCILDDFSMRQLIGDADFKLMFESQYKSEAYVEQMIVKFLGCTYITSTEAPVQSALVSGGPVIRRPLVMGAGSLIECDFEGMETYLRNSVIGGDVAKVELANGVVQVVRSPLDRWQQFLSLSWFWVGGFAVPTDYTAYQSIIPTGSTAALKRAVVLEVAG